MITPEQCRAARGWLDWTQEELAQRASLSLSTVRDFEKRRRVPITNNLSAISAAFEAVGVLSVFREDGSPCGISLGRAVSGVKTELLDTPVYTGDGG
jgi:transcriptional regulator with XRE-family HTH domain